MSDEKEPFLARWSRLKQEQLAGEAAADPVPASAERRTDPQSDSAPPLPPLEELTPQSDFTVFMGPKVADALRRAALKKLFADPQINVPDLFEPFAGDWTGGEAIPQELLARLQQARAAVLGGSGTRDAPQAADANAHERRADEVLAQAQEKEQEQEQEQQQQQQQQQQSRSDGVPGRQDA
ncbi:MAG TPA: DUF3306 domain-containing protein [Burkholderiales bacterium]|nr:DUF3306 domain-containing protein [Burkholderiales bacterium]